ncbi:carboxy terminal-processing peptidase [Flavobacterium beibuense]|uniref:C-terminal processing peptidase n=1 Tax=Flavobacterium beibuense TaxID=657326 RepID=A0A444W9I0_9FLAO|nr:carboxy terminal-processing peptidase [Flavobacterium beibuense]RYJ42443.1 C-terminal processing peptidase [Flavobacterium beibuense]
MKNIYAIACFLPLMVGAQNHEQACGVFYNINELLKSEHFKPKPTDDSLSAYVFNRVMRDLDDNRILFLKEDTDLLAKHEYNIDDYITEGNCAFFTDFVVTYKKALERNIDIINEINHEDLDLNSTDSIYYSKNYFPYRTEKEQLKKLIRKKITYDVLEDIAKLSKDKDSLKAQLPSLQGAAKAKITDAYLCRAEGLLNPEEGLDKVIYHKFYAAFCSYFDPHTNYFNYNDKAAFLSTVSDENYSLGIYVSQNENEEIIVQEVVPGGPAYKTQKIDKGDQILKLASENREYAVTCASIETITNIVFSDAYKTVQLTLRKNDGTVYSVDLEKKVMRTEDNAVYSFVIGDTLPMGYIKIPSFYTAIDDKNYHGCADDVAKEVLKLRGENINGLIIDLQFNGGGSMDEVTKLAGMFIDFGPVCIVTDKNKTSKVIKDYMRGTIYDGPLVILVNGFSASASEFFTGVMQDYGRAIIAGNTTMGKATMQTIYQLQEKDPTDFVKVTIDKFYRITGKSNQYIGIEPDIELPSYLDEFLPREKTEPNALPNDSIKFRVRFHKENRRFYKQAVTLSEERVKSDTDFNDILSVNQKIDKLHKDDKDPVGLNFDGVFTDVHTMDSIWKSISVFEDKVQNPHVATSRDTYQRIMYDDFLSNTNEHRVKLVKNNLYIKEAVNILTDLYNLENR